MHYRHGVRLTSAASAHASGEPANPQQGTLPEASSKSGRPSPAASKPTHSRTHIHVGPPPPRTKVLQYVSRESPKVPPSFSPFPHPEDIRWTDRPRANFIFFQIVKSTLPTSGCLVDTSRRQPQMKFKLCSWLWLIFFSLSPFVFFFSEE